MKRGIDMKKNKNPQLSFGQRMSMLNKARKWVKEKLKADKQKAFNDDVPILKGDSLFGIPEKSKGNPLSATDDVPATETVSMPMNAIEKAIERLREQTNKIIWAGLHRD